jgi:nucleoside-diphosphate-sugar epimerase
MQPRDETSNRSATQDHGWGIAALDPSHPPSGVSNTIHSMTPAERQLLQDISEPDDAVIETMARLSGDLLLLGAGGKIGHGLALMARRALQTAGTTNRVIAVSRFGDRQIQRSFEDDGITTIACDLTDREAIEALPEASDVIYLVGQKFGTSAGNEATTWLMNAYLPGVVAQRWPNSRLAVYSSGNVYPFSGVTTNGPTEDAPVAPLGEYAQSVLGRERVFEYFSRAHGTKVATIRLNYAQEPRYGVLVDIARKVAAGEALDVTSGHANVVWASDVNAVTLRSLDIAASPPRIINLAGPKISVRQVATKFAQRLGKTPCFTGTEANTALLADGSYCWQTFGPPKVNLDEMIERIAAWLTAGHQTWEKPTHYEVRSGRF